jgi:hypothetical protein
VVVVSPLVNSSSTSAICLMPLRPSIGCVQRHSICSSRELVVQPLKVTPDKVDRVICTEEQIDKLRQFAGNFMNGSISSEELVLQLRGENFEDAAFWIGFIL